MKPVYQPYALIYVKDPVLQNFPKEKIPIPPFVTYLVTGKDPHGEFNIRRRYREFLLLRNKLVERFIGIYIPPIPSKRTAGNIQDRYVEERRKFLNYFCQKIQKKPFIFDSDIFQTFIRGDPDFQRAAKLIPNHSYALIANIYDIQFTKLANQINQTQIIVQLETEYQNLKEVEKRLTKIRDELIEVAESKRTFVNQYGVCFKNVLQQYQKEIIKAHDQSDQNIFLSNNQNFIEKITEYLHFSDANVIQDYVQMITYDIREARSFHQAIDSWRNLQVKKANFETARRSSKEELQKLKSGATTLKSIFTLGNKQTQIKQLQSSIPEFQKNEAFLDKCIPLAAVSIHKDIQQFKKSRPVDFVASLQIIALKQMRLLTIYGEMLSVALKDHSQKQIEEINAQK